MVQPRQRRIVKSAVLMLLIPLLLSGYIASFGAMQFLLGRGASPVTFLEPLVNWAYSPLAVYASTGAPGAVSLQKFEVWCFLNGAGEPVEWRQINVTPSSVIIKADTEI